MSNSVHETAAAADATNAGNGQVAPPSFVALALGSVGVVYGDIGTSPLYAFREAAMAASNEQGVTRDVVLGVLSLILWALIVVVTLKYVLLLLRADNNGEGGTLTLMALATRAIGRRTPIIFILGVIGASMFLGDSVITPAISVLSAVEGLKLISPAFTDYVAPLAVFILIALFAAQSRGTAKVAALFGPIMVIWFIAIAVAGGLHILDDPHVLYAINPLYGIAFVAQHGQIGLVTLGAVFLVVTGGEALYADLGHFGRKPIQIAWLSLVLPALLINYFGQGAKVLADPGAIENPFYRLVPEVFLLPMVVLATAATVIASQAVITGAYSLVHQAIQLGLLPRLAILHTSASHVGQIYIPRVTIALLVGVLLLVGLFRTSSALASAYGIAVATTMVVDGLLFFFVSWKLWKWQFWKALAVIVPFVIVDITFFSANFLKLFEGAWAPILFGAGMVLLILTWRRGTSILAGKTRRTEVPIDTLFRNLAKKPPHIVPGTAVFLTSDPDFAPTAMLHNLKHNKVMHEHNVILTIVTADTPRVPEEDRVQITPMSEHFLRVSLKFGYMEAPNVPKALAIARKHGW
ncbi:MAG: potassium transporter Kup, partial [Pseudolabrys sp.]